MCYFLSIHVGSFLMHTNIADSFSSALFSLKQNNHKLLETETILL